MIYYKDSWEETKQRYAAFWNKENTDRCCLAM